MTKREKSVPVTLADGKVRYLLYDYNALAEIVDLLKVEIADLREAMTGPGSLKAIRAILWAGLLHQDESLTPKAAGELIDPMNIGVVTEAVVKALALGLGSDAGEPKNVEAPAPAPEAPSA